MAQNETRIIYFPVEDKLFQPGRRLGPVPPRLLCSRRGFTRNSPLPTHPPPLSGQASQRFWGQFRRTAWRGGRGARELLPGLGEVSALQLPGLLPVSTGGVSGSCRLLVSVPETLGLATRAGGPAEGAASWPCSSPTKAFPHWRMMEEWLRGLPGEILARCGCRRILGPAT